MGWQCFNKLKMSSALSREGALLFIIYETLYSVYDTIYFLYVNVFFDKFRLFTPKT